MTEWHGGKGSKSRPFNKSKFDENFDRIFKQNKPLEEKDNETISTPIRDSEGSNTDIESAQLSLPFDGRENG